MAGVVAAHDSLHQRQDIIVRHAGREGIPKLRTGPVIDAQPAGLAQERCRCFRLMGHGQVAWFVQFR